MTEMTETHSIAIVAWGSLPWQPTARGSTLSTDGVWHLTGPRLPIEFARIAADDRLTLIVVPDYGHTITTLWAPSTHRDLGAARQNLAMREGAVDVDLIHGVTRAGDILGAVDERVGSTVRAWLHDAGVDAALWTGFGPADERWASAGFDGFNPESAASYLSGLQGDTRDRAITYIRNAPPQTDTPVRRLVATRGLLSI